MKVNGTPFETDITTLKTSLVWIDEVVIANDDYRDELATYGKNSNYYLNMSFVKEIKIGIHHEQLCVVATTLSDSIYLIDLSLQIKSRY